MKSRLVEHLLSIESSVKLCAFIEAIRSDNKAVRDFLKFLRKQTSACSHELEKCPVCQNVCFFEEAKRTARKTA